MPLKVFVKDLAIVTAGFSNEVEDVNQYAELKWLTSTIIDDFIVQIYSLKSSRY